MRVLQINSVANYSSTGRIAEGIGQVVLDNGWESFIAYGRRNSKSSSELIKIGNKWDVKLHGIQTRLWDNHGLGSRKATLDFINKIKELKPDVVHLHNIHGYYINIEVLFNYLAAYKIPIVWTLHDCWSFTGHCVYFDYVDCEKWKKGCFMCPQQRSYPSSYILDRSKRNYIIKRNLFTSVDNMIIVPVSNWLESLGKESFLNRYCFHVVRNGIDLRSFFYDKSCELILKYRLNNKFVILGVANTWSTRKGLHEFIKLSEFFDSQTKIILVGLDEAQLKEIPENIIGIKRTESLEELRKLYSCADVFVNPTWEDNFPTTNLEAMACGTPVITYDTGGSSEAIDKNTGVVVERGNLEALINAIEKVKLNGKKYYLEPCTLRAKKYFDNKLQFAKYIGLYERLIVR